MAKFLIIAGHIAALLVGCVLIGLAINGFERVGLPREIGTLFSFALGLLWGALIFTLLADKLEG